MHHIHIYFMTKRKWTKILAHLIRFIQKTEYDHAAWGISFGLPSETFKKPVSIQEATLDGVVSTDRQEFLDKHTRIVAEYKIILTDEQLHKLLDFIAAHHGKKYSVKQLLGNAYIIMMKRWFKKDVTKNIYGNGAKEFVCAEHLGMALKIIGATLPGVHTFESIDIRDCMDMTKQLEKAIRMK